MKNLSILLVITLVLGLFSISAFAADTQATLSTATVEKGETAELTLSLSGCSGFSNLGFEIGYDHNALTLISATPNTAVGATFTPAQSYSKTPYNVGWDSTFNTVFNGKLATFTFKVADNAKPGVYPITLSYYKGINDSYVDGYDVNYDEGFNSLNMTYTSGSITIESDGASTEPDPEPDTDGAVVTISSAESEKGGTVDVDLSINGCAGFSNIGFEIAYDVSALQLTSVTPNTAVGATFTPAQSYSKTPYNVGWDSTFNTVFNGKLATLTFKVADDAKPKVYPITLSYYKGINGSYVDGYDVNYDENFSSLGLSYNSGSITITDNNTISISATDASTSQQVIIDVVLNANEYIGTVLAGLYSGNKLVCLKMYDAKDSIDVMFDKGEIGTCVKIMWWDNPKSMNELCSSEVIVPK